MDNDLLERADRLEQIVQMAERKVKYQNDKIDEGRRQINSLTSKAGELSDENKLLRYTLSDAEHEGELSKRHLESLLDGYESTVQGSLKLTDALEVELEANRTEMSELQAKSLLEARESKIVDAELELTSHLLKALSTSENWHQSMSRASAEHAKKAFNTAEAFMKSYAEDLEDMTKSYVEVLIQQHIMSNSIEDVSTVRQRLEATYRNKLNRLKTRVTSLLQNNVDLSRRLSESLLNERMLKEEVNSTRQRDQQFRTEINERTDNRVIFDEEVVELRTRIEQDGDHQDALSFCDNLQKLYEHYSKLESQHRSKTEELQQLDSRVQELGRTMTDLLKLENDLGYEKLKEIPKQYKKAVKDFEELDKREGILKQKVRWLEGDQQAKNRLIDRMTKENQLLLFLNERLVAELVEVAPDYNPARYSREYFRRRKMLTPQESDVMIHVEDLYRSREDANRISTELTEKLDETMKRMEELRADLSRKNELLARQSKEIETYQNENQLLNRDKEALGELQDHISSLNSQLVEEESKVLKDEVRRLVEANNELNLKLLDREILLERQMSASSRQKLELEGLSKLYVETVENCMKTEKTKVKVMEKELSILKLSSDGYRFQNDLLKERVSSFEQTFETLNTYFIELEERKSDEREVLKRFFNILSESLRKHKKEFDDSRARAEHYAKDKSVLNRFELELRLKREHEELRDFKVQALSAYSSILEEKNDNLERSLKEYFTKIEELEKERESLEANSALEKIKTYMESKRHDLDSYTNRLEGILQQSEDNRRREVEDSQAVSKAVEDACQESRKQLEVFQEEYKKKFEAVLAKSEEQVRAFKQQSDETIRERMEEVESLKTRLESVEFEGRQELIVQLDQLLKLNAQMRSEITALEVRSRLLETNIGIAEELTDAQSKYSQTNVHESQDVQAKKLIDENSQLKQSIDEYRRRELERTRELESRTNAFNALVEEILARMESLTTTIEGREELENEIAAYRTRLLDLKRR